MNNMVGRLSFKQNNIEFVVNVIADNNIITLLRLLHDNIGFKVKPVLGTRGVCLTRVIPSYTCPASFS
ncbi:hypothetical protein TU79_05490 [Pseudomonas trivialis]|uniref:Uncharacterized protein n=1 Tax=Pseudomonas trivialis TaxID=200450 RepID=A0A0R2ZT38_9PSED|nr:hypothetical protein TU79_05490 [Pseudomonas trivialis]